MVLSNGRILIEKDMDLLKFREYKELSINQMRILNYYIGMIDFENEHTIEQIIPINDLLSAYNLNKGSVKNLVLAVKNLNNIWHTDTYEYNENGIKVFEKFEMTSVIGGRAILIKPTREFKYFIFDSYKYRPEKYVSYKLNNVSNLNSTKYLILYELLTDEKKNRATLNVKDIISKIGLDNCKNCTDVRHNFLNSAVKQINKCTNIKIVSTSIERRGMLAENIVFDIEYSDSVNKIEDYSVPEPTPNTITFSFDNEDIQHKLSIFF